MNQPVLGLDISFAFAATALVRNIGYRLPYTVPPGGGAPVDSPLKVWDGAAWRPAGVKVAS